MEEKQTILALGAGASSKFVFRSEHGHRIERVENVKSQGNVDDEGGCTDRQVPQVVQNQGDAGDTAGREICELCKGIDADCGKDAAKDVAE